MAGVKGRSGRLPKGVEEGNKRAISEIKGNVHNALCTYTRHLLKRANEDKLTSQEAQQLVTLHMKHAPDPPKEKEDKAIDILKQMAIEGAKEFARIKATRANDIHNEIMQPIDITPVRDSITTDSGNNGNAHTHEDCTGDTIT